MASRYQTRNDRNQTQEHRNTAERQQIDWSHVEEQTDDQSCTA
jgi:hypothetical protein